MISDALTFERHDLRDVDSWKEIMINIIIYGFPLKKHGGEVEHEFWVFQVRSWLELGLGFFGGTTGETNLWWYPQVSWIVLVYNIYCYNGNY